MSALYSEVEVVVVLDLKRAVEADQIVAGLREAGLTQRDIAAGVGVTDRTVRSWATQRSSVHTHNYDRLADLREIVVLLSDSLSPLGVSQWFHARNRVLGGQRPIDALRAGNDKRVLGAASAFVEGVYL
ncbi:MAG: hypothetical protein RLZ55_604 [Actinomycetota bacterium]